MGMKVFCNICSCYNYSTESDLEVVNEKRKQSQRSILIQAASNSKVMEDNLSPHWLEKEYESKYKKVSEFKINNNGTSMLETT